MVKKLKQQYETPSEGWSQERIRKEDELLEQYGLKNKKEVYKAESELRNLRREARRLIAEEDETQRKDLIDRLNNLGLIRSDAELEDILTLNTTDILNRRLQTAVNRRGYSETVREARQLVTHGHVYINGEKVNIPGYLLTKEEEQELEVRKPEPSETEEQEETEEVEEESENEEQEEKEEEADE